MYVRISSLHNQDNGNLNEKKKGPKENGIKKKCLQGGGLKVVNLRIWQYSIYYYMYFSGQNVRFSVIH